MDNEFKFIFSEAKDIKLGEEVVQIKFATLNSLMLLMKVAKEVEGFLGIVDALFSGAIETTEDMAIVTSRLVDALAKEEVMENYIRFLSTTTSLSIEKLKALPFAAIIFISKAVFKENWDFLEGSLLKNQEKAQE